jgi:hypothetical protein
VLGPFLLSTWPVAVSCLIYDSLPTFRPAADGGVALLSVDAVFVKQKGREMFAIRIRRAEKSRMHRSWLLCAVVVRCVRGAPGCWAGWCPAAAPQAAGRAAASQPGQQRGGGQRKAAAAKAKRSTEPKQPASKSFSNQKKEPAITRPQQRRAAVAAGRWARGCCLDWRRRQGGLLRSSNIIFRLSFRSSHETSTMRKRASSSSLSSRQEDLYPLS